MLRQGSWTAMPIGLRKICRDIQYCSYMVENILEILTFKTFGTTVFWNIKENNKTFYSDKNFL